MEFDLEQETRVWNRVLGGDGAARLGELARQEARCASEDWALARRLGDRRLGELARRERQAAGDLNVACYLLTGEKPAPVPPVSPREPAAEILRRRFSQGRELAAVYGELAGQIPELAPLLTSLARDADTRSSLLLRVLRDLL